MPNQRKAGTSSHQFWCEDELWAAGLETAGRVGTNVSKVIRDALADFVASNALESEGAPAPAPSGTDPWQPPTPIDLFLMQDPPACPACGSGLDPWRPMSANEAAWAHMEKCPGLVELARQAGII